MFVFNTLVNTCEVRADNYNRMATLTLAGAGYGMFFCIIFAVDGERLTTAAVQTDSLPSITQSKNMFFEVWFFRNVL